MRLKYHVDLLEAALSGGRQRGANLGRMMAIVVNHADPGCLAAQLEPPVYAAEIFQRRADVIGSDIETDSHCNGCGGVQNVVYSRHMQAEFAQITLPVGDLKTAGRLLSRSDDPAESRPSLTQLDVKIRASPCSVADRSPPNLRKQARATEDRHCRPRPRRKTEPGP